MIQQVGYNPYAPNQNSLPPNGGPQGGFNQNPFGNNNQGPKTISLPNWALWLIGIGFIAFCVILVWVLYF